MNIGFRYPVAHRGQGFPRPNPIVAVGGGGGGESTFTFFARSNKTFFAWDDFGFTTINEPV